MVLLKLEVDTATRPVWALHVDSNELTGKEGTYLLDFQGANGLLFHKANMNEYVWNTGNTQRNILIIPWPMIKVNVKLQQSSKS